MVEIAGHDVNGRDARHEAPCGSVLCEYRHSRVVVHIMGASSCSLGGGEMVVYLMVVEMVLGGACWSVVSSVVPV